MAEYNALAIAANQNTSPPTSSLSVSPLSATITRPSTGHSSPQEPTRCTYDGLCMHYHTRAEKLRSYWLIKYAWYTDDSKRCREGGLMSVCMEVSTGRMLKLQWWYEV